MRMNSGTGRTRKAGRLGAAALLAAGALGATAATAAAAPSTTASPFSGLSLDAATTVAVGGNGFTADTVDQATGLYAAVTATVSGTIHTDMGGAQWLRTGNPAGETRLNADGTFATAVRVQRRFMSGATEIDCAVTQCSVRTWRAHGLPTDGNTLTTLPLRFQSTAPASTSITVTPTRDIAREGETTLTVSGTGFDVAAAGGRGFYLVYGPKAPGFWQGSATASYGAAKWFSPVAGPGRELLAPDGSFNTTLTISPVYTGRNGATYDCRIVSCSVLTFAAQGNIDAALDTDTPLSFVPLPPRVEVSPTTGLNRDNVSNVTVRGSDFSTGTYVSQAAIVNGEVVTPEQTAAKWIRRGGPTPEETLNADGTFTTTVSVVPTFTPRGGAPVDCRVTTCVIATWRQHSNPTVAALYTSTALAFAAAPDVRPQPRPEPQPAPEATVTKVKTQTLGSKRGARIGFVTCKADCAVSIPKSVKVKIGKKKYTAKVVAPKSAKAGKRVQIRVTLTTAAAKALAGRSAKISVNVKLTANGQTETKKVTATVKAKKAKKAAKKPAAKQKAAAKR